MFFGPSSRCAAFKLFVPQYFPFLLNFKFLVTRIVMFNVQRRPESVRLGGTGILALRARPGARGGACQSVPVAALSVTVPGGSHCQWQSRWPMHCQSRWQWQT